MLVDLLTSRDWIPGERVSELNGIAYLTGDKRTSVDHLPKGFKIVEFPSKMGSIDIFCITDNVSAFE